MTKQELQGWLANLRVDLTHYVQGGTKLTLHPNDAAAIDELERLVAAPEELARDKARMDWLEREHHDLTREIIDAMMADESHPPQGERS